MNDERPKDGGQCICCNCGNPEHLKDAMHQSDLDGCGECHNCFRKITP